MAGPLPKTLKTLLATAVAGGTEVKAWCQTHGVKESTAYEWTRQDWFKTAVADYRDRAVDRALGKIADHAGTAADKIIELVEKASTDQVKLSASRTVIDQLIHVQKHVELKAEIRALQERMAAEEKRRERDRRRNEKADGSV